MQKIASWILLFVTVLLLSFADGAPGNGGDMKNWDAGDLQRRGLRGRYGDCPRADGKPCVPNCTKDGKPCRGQDGCTDSDGKPCGPSAAETVEEPPVRLLHYGHGSGHHGDCPRADGKPCAPNCTKDGEPCRGRDGCTDSDGKPCGPSAGETVEAPPVRGLHYGHGSGRHGDCPRADGKPCVPNCTKDGKPCRGQDGCTDSDGKPCGPGVGRGRGGN